MQFEMQPIAVFRLGTRKVIRCRMLRGQPGDAFRDHLTLLDGSLCVCIRLTGLSTAWGQDGVFDFTFEGPLNPPVELSASAVLVSSSEAIPLASTSNI